MANKRVLAAVVFLWLSFFLPELLAQTVTLSLKWQHGGCYSSWCETGWYSSPAALDIDQDGDVEVIAGTYSLFILKGSDGSVIYACDPDGGRVWPGIVVADLDGNGSFEIVSAHGGGWLHVFDNTLTSLWSRQPVGNELRGLSVYDLDGNGDLEIIVTGAVYNEVNTWVYEHTGDLRPGWPQLANTSGYAYGIFNDNAAVADLDGDGMGEIVVPSDVHYICAYEADGQAIPAHSMYGSKAWGKVGVWESLDTELQGWGTCDAADPRAERYRTNFAHGPAVIADMDGDGSQEVVATGNVYDCAYGHPPGKYTGVYVFNADRSRFCGSGYDWQTLPVDTGAPLSEDYTEIENCQPNPVVADLDGDGHKEILFASYDGCMHVFWLDKTEHHSWPYDVTQAGGYYRFASEPVVADLDSNGYAEVIFTSWVEKDSYETGKLHILDYQGTVVCDTDLPPAFGSPTWNGGLPAPTLANIDSDNDLEIVVNTAHSGVVAYDLTGTTQAVLLWPTGRGSFQRCGSLSTTAVPLAAPVLQAPVDESQLSGTAVNCQWQDTNTNPQEQGMRLRYRSLAGTYAYQDMGADATSCLLSLAAGKTYYWNVRALGDQVNTLHSEWANSGQDWSFTLTDGAPVVTTGKPAALSATHVCLSGTVDPLGHEVSTWFEWGNSGYGQQTEAVCFNSPDPVTWHALVNGLTPGTEYHFRAVAASSQAVVRGQDKAFTTLSADTPVLLYPAHGAQRMPLDPVLQWTAGSNQGFRVRYKRVIDVTYTYRTVGLDTCWLELPGLETGTGYNWSVKRLSTVKDSDWARDRVFYTRTDAGSPVCLAYAREDAGFRSNLGLSNLLSTNQTVTAWLYDASGTPAAQKTYDVAAQAYLPVPHVITDMCPSGAPATGWLEISGPEWVDVIGGMVDEVTSDPSVAQASGPGNSQLVTPIVLRSGPWQTRISLANTADVQSQVYLEFISLTSGRTSYTLSRTIPGHGVYATDDIISAVGAPTGSFGMLSVQSASPLAAFCHQYTSAHTGGCYPFYSLLEAEQVHYFPHVSDTTDFRSNLGLLSMNDASAVTVTCDFYRNGQLDASRSLALAPGQYSGLPDIIRWVRGQTSLQNVSGMLRVAADGPVFALGGLVDNQTSDPGVHGGISGLHLRAYTPLVLRSGPWKTRVVLANFHNQPVAVTLYARHINGSLLLQTEETIAALNRYTSEDIIASLGLGDGTVARLEVTADLPICGYICQYTDSHTSGVYPFLPD